MHFILRKSNFDTTLFIEKLRATIRIGMSAIGGKEDIVNMSANDMTLNRRHHSARDPQPRRLRIWPPSEQAETVRLTVAPDKAAELERGKGVYFNYRIRWRCIMASTY